MEVKNCRRCKRLFNYIGGQQICPTCREEIEAEFQKVKKYLFEHRNATIAEVSEECDVDERQIRQWIREERLEFTNGIDASLTCEVCGAPITSGKYCDNCKAKMANELSIVGRRPETPKQEQVKKADKKPQMRFLNK